MGDYIDVYCQRCKKTVGEVWAEDLTLRIDVEIQACYDCGFADGEAECESTDEAWREGYREGFEDGLAEGKESEG